MIDLSERPLFVVSDNYREIPEGAIPVRRVKRSDEFRYPLAKKVLNFLRSDADIYFPFALSSVPAVDFLVVSEKGSLGTFGRRLSGLFRNKPNIRVLESQTNLRVSPLRGNPVRDLALDLTLMSEDEFEECLNRKIKQESNMINMGDFFKDYVKEFDL